MRFLGKLEYGEIHLDDPSAFDKYVAAAAPGPVEVIIKPSRETRSAKANSFYWSAVIPPLAEFCGYDSEEMHECLKHRFLRIHSGKAGVPDTSRSTKSLDSKEFSDYVENCLRLAAELGVAIKPER